MKKIIQIFFLGIIISCNKTGKTSISDIIDCDETANYISYFNALSDEYKILLKEDYKTINEKIIIEKIKQERISNYNAIKEGSIIVKSKILTEKKSSIPNITIIKYRRTIYDTKQENAYYNDNVVIKISNSEKDTFFPYNKSSLPKTDSILNKKYSPVLINEINSILKRKQFSSIDVNFPKVKERLNTYMTYLENNNPAFIDMVYPPVFKIFCAENDRSCINEIKKELANSFINSTKYFKPTDFVIESFEQIKNNKNIYFLNYSYLYEDGRHFINKTIVFKYADEIYFLEYSKEQMKTYSNLFSDLTLNAIVELAEKIKPHELQKL
ncbi:hypothetical protein [Flavobacterium nitratireducens]|uniref:hypothetical protein n=1 Tax=Flavobacterium nitratireducens TaxID=992289 RepID=UPI0024157AAE|nr:hypothetical protein [Flavobacterium nitratireducens]